MADTPLVLASGALCSGVLLGNASPFHVEVGGIVSSGYGVIASGYIDRAPIFSIKCAGCGAECGRDADWKRVVLYGVSIPHLDAGIFCLECAGYKEGEGFTLRRDWIIKSIPLVPETPIEIMIGWLEDHNRDEDAEYMRRFI